MASFLRLRAHWVVLSAVFCLLCRDVSVFGQAASADYTKDLPSVERVKAEIKGSDPTDTLARQVAVFTYLQSYISRIKMNRTVRGDYTPGESKMMGLYSVAAFQMSQDFAKTHTPAEAAAFERLHGNYEMDGAFYQDWSKRLIGPQTAAAYSNAEAGLTASGEKRYQQAMADYKRDSAAQQAADKQIFGTQRLSNDPTAVAARRCLELGGSSLGCAGKGLTAGFMDMIGFAGVQESLTGSGKAGLVLSGLYKDPATVTTLGFAEDSVSVNDCGTLVNDGHNYLIERAAGSLRVTVDNEPRPIVLTMRADGGLIGPGPIDVKGRVIVGYHIETTTPYRDGVPVGPSSTVRIPEYAPRIERCIIGSLAMPPSLPPASASAPPANDSGALGILTGVLTTLAPDAGEVGLRMAGQYGGGKLLLDFRGNSLILDCGEAHVRQPYTVERTSSALLIHVQNSGAPFTLTLQPDESLRGSGSTTVNGRLVSGMRGEDVTFTPHTETCDVGAFRPKGGAGR